MMKNREKYAAVCRKIKFQFPTSAEGKLMFAIVESAIKDLKYSTYRTSAVNYLRGGIEHAEIAGVDSKWIRYQLKQIGEDLEHSRGP